MLKYAQHQPSPLCALTDHSIQFAHKFSRFIFQKRINFLPSFTPKMFF